MRLHKDHFELHHEARAVSLVGLADYHPEIYFEVLRFVDKAAFVHTAFDVSAVVVVNAEESTFEMARTAAVVLDFALENTV